MITDFLLKAALGSKSTLIKLLFTLAENAYEHNKHLVAEKLLGVIPNIKDTATKEEMLDLMESIETVNEKLAKVLH